MDDLNPRWKPFSVLDADLCRGDYNAQLKLVVFDWDKVIIRAAQIFWGLMLQTPNLRLAQILKVYQVSGPSGDV